MAQSQTYLVWRAGNKLKFRLDGVVHETPWTQGRVKEIIDQMERWVKVETQRVRRENEPVPVDELATPDEE